LLVIPGLSWTTFFASDTNSSLSAGEFPEANCDELLVEDKPAILPE
jgi:hypothetical protein